MYYVVWYCVKYPSKMNCMLERGQEFLCPVWSLVKRWRPTLKQIITAFITLYASAEWNINLAYDI